VIAFLEGRLFESDGDAAVVEVAGVGYQVLVSAATAAASTLENASAATSPITACPR